MITHVPSPDQHGLCLLHLSYQLVDLGPFVEIKNKQPIQITPPCPEQKKKSNTSPAHTQTALQAAIDGRYIHKYTHQIKPQASPTSAKFYPPTWQLNLSGLSTLEATMRYSVRTSFFWAILTKVDQGSKIHLVSVVYKFIGVRYIFSLVFRRNKNVIGGH